MTSAEKKAQEIANGVMCYGAEGKRRLTKIIALAITEAVAQAESKAFQIAAKVSDDRASLWRSYGGCKLGGTSGHLTVEGECDVITNLILKNIPRTHKPAEGKKDWVDDLVDSGLLGHEPKGKFAKKSTEPRGRK